MEYSLEFAPSYLFFSSVVMSPYVSFTCLAVNVKVVLVTIANAASKTMMKSRSIKSFLNQPKKIQSPLPSPIRERNLCKPSRQNKKNFHQDLSFQHNQRYEEIFPSNCMMIISFDFIFLHPKGPVDSKVTSENYGSMVTQKSSKKQKNKKH